MPRFAAVYRALSDDGFRIILLLRLSPVVPFSLLNYALGMTRVQTRHYIWATIIGILPGTFLYVYLGTLSSDVAAIARGDLPPSGLWGKVGLWLGLAATLAVTVSITRIARKSLAERLGDDLSA